MPLLRKRLQQYPSGLEPTNDVLKFRSASLRFRALSWQRQATFELVWYGSGGRSAMEIAAWVLVKARTLRRLPKYSNELEEEMPGKCLPRSEERRVGKE